MLIECTQERVFDPSKELRYADTRKDEQERELSMDPVVIFEIILCRHQVHSSDTGT